MSHINKNQTLEQKISLTPLSLGLVGLGIVFLGIISLFAARDSEVFVVQENAVDAAAYRNPFGFNIESGTPAGITPAQLAPASQQAAPTRTTVTPKTITINISGQVSYQYLDGTTGPAKGVKVQIPATIQAPINTTTNDSGVYNLKNVPINSDTTSVDISVINPLNGIPIWKKVSVNGAGNYYANFSFPAKRVYGTISGFVRMKSGVATVPVVNAAVSLPNGQTTFTNASGAYTFTNIPIDKQQEFKINASKYIPSTGEVKGYNSVTLSPSKTTGSVSIIVQ